MDKMRVALLFGGVSSEHEVSRVSAGTILNNLDQSLYDISLIGITRDGRWMLTQANSDQMADGSWENLPENRKCLISPDRADHGLLIFEEDGVVTLPVDVVFPVLHGKNGEDGTLQGLLELAAIPYVGCGVLASAACMDKSVTNTLFDAAGIPHCKWDWCHRRDTLDFLALEQRLLEKLSYPIFVKPASAGSSVGISKAHNREELQTAVQVALAEDNKVVFEEFIDGQEVECATMGNLDPTATLPGEILAGAEFYTYDDKYKNGVSRTIYPADLPKEKLEEVRDWAEKAYLALGCTGLSRCDFFVERSTGRVLINEINTLPGFTPISMYPVLMARSGLPIARLLDRLIDYAMERAGA